MKKRSYSFKARPDRMTQKDLASRWKCSLRTVQRRFARHYLPPVNVLGNCPEFDKRDIAAYERKHAKAWERRRLAFRRFGKLSHKKKLGGAK